MDHKVDARIQAAREMLADCQEQLSIIKHLDDAAEKWRRRLQLAQALRVIADKLGER